MPSMVYFRKNCETMLLFIKANIMFNFYCNATIIIIGTRSAGMDVLYHQNFFLEVYRLMTDETIHFQHSYYYVMKVVINYLHEFGFFHQMLKLIRSGRYPELLPNVRNVHIHFFIIHFLFFLAFLVKISVINLLKFSSLKFLSLSFILFKSCIFVSRPYFFVF